MNHNTATRDRSDPLWVRFADCLRRERLRRGLDQVELADMLGVSLRTLRNWENCHAWPPKAQLFKLIAAFWVYDKEMK